MSRTTALNVLFFAAGCAAAAIDTAIYRIALIVIVLLLRALWARVALKRSRTALIEKISRRAHASQQANPLAHEQYQAADLPQYEYLQG
jgi:hypothetical protein